MNRTKFIAVLYGWITICLLLLFFALIMTFVIKFTSINDLTIIYVAFSISSLSMFFGGIVTGMKGKDNGWLLGVITGIGFILCVYIIQFTFIKQTFLWQQYIYHATFILVAIAGSILGVNLVSESKEN